MALTDAERIERAKYRRPRWYGPDERSECEHHPGYFKAWRWTWKGARQDIEDAGVELVQECSECGREEPSDE